MNNITVYGGGVIGSGWAIAFLLGGKNVTVYDVNEECLSSTKERIESWYLSLSEIDPECFDKDRILKSLAGVVYTTDTEQAVASADFIQECGPEKLQIKQAIVKSIEEFNHTSIIASSTSGQTVTDIAAYASFPERIIAGHPFNPVHLMPLVEVCGGEKTSKDVLAKAKEIYASIGKMPVVLEKEIPGFIANRIQNALNREVQDLVLNGVASVEDIDKAVTFGIGIRLGIIGPHLVYELAGGEGGISDYVTKYRPSQKSLGSLANWTERPIEYDQLAINGTKEELLNRTPDKGNSHESLEHYRDKGLIEQLKFHQLTEKWRK